MILQKCFMRTDKARFRYLYDKFISKTATDAERDAFLDLVADDHYSSLLRRLIRMEVDRSDSGREMNDAIAEQIYEQIITTNKRLSITAEDRSIRWHRSHWWAAAAVLCIMALGGYLLTTREQHRPVAGKQNITAPLENDVAPGHAGAILTLSDGTQLVLDSMPNGVLASQGSINIVKEGSSLSYGGHLTSAAETLYNTMTTPRGRQFQLVLPDGSEVWLNAASSIRFPTSFSDNGRTVEISGEAYFEVKPLWSKSRKRVPFTVVINSTPGVKREVQVLGTHFNINAYTNESAVKTTLIEGSVKVMDGSRSATISPGEQAVMANNAGQKLSVTRDADLGEAMAWKNGFFSFGNATIETIMRQVERWYDVQVEYSNGVPPGHYAGEVPMNVNASEMLKVLRVGGIHFRIEGKKIIIL